MDEPALDLTPPPPRPAAEPHRVESLASLGSWCLHLDSNHLQLSPQAARIAGLDGLDHTGHEALVARIPEPDRSRVGNAWERALSGERFEVEYPLDLGDEMRWIWERAEFERDRLGRPLRAVGVIQDISARRDSENEILSWANRDPLTGLPNRNQLGNHLRHALSLARRHHRRLALLFIDLDRFKQVNDSLGHDAGDKLLREAAKRIASDLRDSDLVARLGGDEFMVVLEDVDLDAQAGIVAKKLVESLTQPFQLEEGEARIGASIGIALYPEDGGDDSALLRNADLAMYRAKATGRSTLSFFSPDLNDQAVERQLIEADLRHAFEHLELALYFQPVVNLAEPARPVAAEALIRWHHPHKGLLNPQAFIANAESMGLAGDLARWTLAEACRQMADWRARGLTLPVSLNLSGRLIPNDLSLDWLAGLLERHGLPPDLLGLEFHQEVLQDDDPKLEHWLKSARALGLRLILDDFGAGAISLERLLRTPLSQVKINRDFVLGLETDPSRAVLLKSLVGLARELNLDVVAKGVESPAVLARLADMGCQGAQGFLIDPPLTPEDLARRLDAAARA